MQPVSPLGRAALASVTSAGKGGSVPVVVQTWQFTACQLAKDSRIARSSASLSKPSLAGSGETVPASYQNYSLTGNKAFLNNRLNNSLTVSYQPSGEGKNIALNGTHGFSVTKRDVINLTWYVAWFTPLPRPERTP